MAERKTILSKENTSLALRMFAEGHSPNEIVKHFHAQNIPCPVSSTIYDMTRAKCHQVEIETYREDYYARIKDVPISRKRTRLEDRQELRNAIKKTLSNLIASDGSINKRQYKIFMALAKRLDETLVGAQDEMEKRPGMIVALNQNFGDRELSMEELIVEERNITRRIAELQGEGISLPRRTP